MVFERQPPATASCYYDAQPPADRCAGASSGLPGSTGAGFMVDRSRDRCRGGSTSFYAGWPSGTTSTRSSSARGLITQAAPAAGSHPPAHARAEFSVAPDMTPTVYKYGRPVGWLHARQQALRRAPSLAYYAQGDPHSRWHRLRPRRRWWCLTAWPSTRATLRTRNTTWPRPAPCSESVSWKMWTSDGDGWRLCPTAAPLSSTARPEF